MSDAVALDLPVGSSVQMQPLGDPAAPRYSAQVIGQIPGVSILVSTPVLKGRVQMIREGQMFVLRCISHEQALGFNSRVLRSNMQPYPYLHLSYPDESQRVTLRGARRVSVQLAGQIQRTGDGDGRHWGTPTSVTVRDISAGGAMIDSPRSPGNVGDRLRLAMQFPIEHMAEQSVAIEAVVRMFHENDSAQQRFRYGVEFVDLEPSAELALRVYVYERLLTADDT